MTNIGTSLEFNHHNEPQLPVQPLSNLVAQLSHHATDIDYHLDCQPIIADQQLYGVCSLEVYSFSFMDGGDWVIQLTQRNDSTLQSMDIHLAMIRDIGSLIQNADNSYVQYPCLNTLEIKILRGSGE
ncbi:hypothetical protein GGI13_004079 [Coemansia sp. RSA 455]|nr:hypothetical protein IW146_002791 [Coemansia sp. RSA 922]KAJ2250171.1 hypothetical protein GGI13_004079 [Coemansia sp. RSA 455]